VGTRRPRPKPERPREGTAQSQRHGLLDGHLCVCLVRGTFFSSSFFFSFHELNFPPLPVPVSSMAGLGATGEGEGAVATGKRPLDAVAKPEAVPAEDGAQEKRARVEGGATGASGGGDAATAALQAALPLEKAVEATEAASGLKVCLDTTKVEVCWQVADEEAEDSSPIILW